MNATTQIYRGIEDIVKPEIERDVLVERVIKHLNKINLNTDFLNDIELKKLDSYQPTLNPSQILVISKYMKKLPENIDKIDYLGKLIQKSYDVGNNGFILDNFKDDFNVSHLEGSEQKKIEIKLLESTNNDVGFASYNCHILVEKNAESTGRESEHCFVEIKGNLHVLYSSLNSYSVYKIHGELKSISGSISWFSNVKLILNPEQYKIWKPKEKNCKGLSIELMKK